MGQNKNISERRTSSGSQGQCQSDGFFFCNFPNEQNIFLTVDIKSWASQKFLNKRQISEDSSVKSINTSVNESIASPQSLLVVSGEPGVAFTRAFFSCSKSQTQCLHLQPNSKYCMPCADQPEDAKQFSRVLQHWNALCTQLISCLSRLYSFSELQQLLSYNWWIFN